MGDSYLGGSTLIKTRTKGWWKGKRKRAKTNNEKHNNQLKRESLQRNLMSSWNPQYFLIKKDDADKR